jgi:hypothetical protein
MSSNTTPTTAPPQAQPLWSTTTTTAWQRQQQQPALLPSSSSSSAAAHPLPHARQPALQPLPLLRQQHCSMVAMQAGGLVQWLFWTKGC